MFNLPTYRITPSAHPVKCPPQCPSPSHPNALPTSLSTTPNSFPRDRSLSCSVSLSDISHSFSLLLPLFPFLIFYIPRMNETIWWLSFSEWLTSLSIIPSRSIHVEANGGYLSFLMAEEYPIVYRDHSFSIHHLSMDTEAPSTVWLLWTLLLETSGCRCPGISLHLYLWGKSPACLLYTSPSPRDS